LFTAAGAENAEVSQRGKGGLLSS